MVQRWESADRYVGWDGQEAVTVVMGVAPTVEVDWVAVGSSSTADADTVAVGPSSTDVALIVAVGPSPTGVALTVAVGPPPTKVGMAVAVYCGTAGAVTVRVNTGSKHTRAFFESMGKEAEA